MLIIDCRTPWQIWNGALDSTDHTVRQYWLYNLRSFICKVYDVSIRNFADHPVVHQSTVFDMLARDWEYVEGDWDMKKFAQECCRCLKRERGRLRKYWNDKCQRKLDVPGPARISAEVWARLVGWYASPAGIEESKKMSGRRGHVVDLTRVGRGGIVAKQQTMVK